MAPFGLLERVGTVFEMVDYVLQLPATRVLLVCDFANAPPSPVAIGHCSSHTNSLYVCFLHFQWDAVSSQFRVV